MKKKVIFVSTALWIGGIESSLVNLLNAMDYEKYEITLLILRAELDMLPMINNRCKIIIADRGEPYSFDSPYKYKRLFHLTEKSENPSKVHRLMMWSVPFIRYVENLLWISYIRRMMQGYNYDSCIIYSDVNAEIAVKAIKADNYLMFYHHGAMRRVYHDTYGYKKCSHIIAVSDFQAEMLKNFIPAYSDKIITIHNLLDLSEVRRKAEQAMDVVFYSDCMNIVTVGRVSKEKGMDIAVDCCEKLIEKGYANIHWWIVGGGTELRNIEDYINEKFLSTHVTTLGMKSNPYPYMKNADLYVQPSRLEGYPMTLLEALALGQPVISTDNSGAREIIHEGIDGIFCKINADSLTDSVEYVLCHPEVIEEMKTSVKQIDFASINSEIIKRIEDVL